MTERTKSERQASARKAAATRQQREAARHVRDAQSSANSAFSRLVSALRSLGDAALASSKSVANRATAIARG